MNDTDPKIAEKLRALWAKKTPQERLLMGCSMFDTAKRLATSTIQQQDPNVSNSVLRRELFLRFYGHEFDAVRKEKILSWLNRF